MSFWVSQEYLLTRAELSLACHAFAEGSAEGWLVWDGLGWVTQLGFTWSLILQQASPALFSWQRRGSKREPEQARPLENWHNGTHCNFLAKESFKNSPNSPAGEIHSTIWWEELWSPLKRAWVWTIGPLVQSIYSLQLLLSLMCIYMYIIYIHTQYSTEEKKLGTYERFNSNPKEF